MNMDREGEKSKVIGHSCLDQSSPIIPLCFDNIPISPYEAALWHTRPAWTQKSLLLLVTPHKLNLHSEYFGRDVPDAKIWINIKALREAMCLYASAESWRKFSSARPPTLFSMVENELTCMEIGLLLEVKLERASLCLIFLREG